MAAATCALSSDLQSSFQPSITQLSEANWIFIQSFSKKVTNRPSCEGKAPFLAIA